MTPIRLTDAARWALCFALVLFFHIAGAVALMARWTDDDDLVANAPVIMIELAPVPVAPQTQRTEMPPDIVESQAAESEPEPEPEKPRETVELLPEPEAELNVMPPPKPPEKKAKEKPKQRRASLASAPSTAEQKAERAIGPPPGPSSHNSNALPKWKSQLVAQLERAKRYPPDAQGASGVAQLAFSVDRSGGVHHARIVRSSGSSALDQATLALIGRAQPLSPPPPEIQGAQISIVVPIRYSVR